MMDKKAKCKRINARLQKNDNGIAFKVKKVDPGKLSQETKK